PCNPALCTRLQRGTLSCGQLQPHALPKKGNRLLKGKAQVGCPQLAQLPTCTQTGQGQLGILSGEQDQGQLGREVSGQIGDGRVDQGRGQEVVVIQDEDEGVGQQCGDVVEQCGQ